MPRADWVGFGSWRGSWRCGGDGLDARLKVRELVAAGLDERLGLLEHEVAAGIRPSTGNLKIRVIGCHSEGGCQNT